MSLQSAAHATADLCKRTAAKESTRTMRIIDTSHTHIQRMIWRKRGWPAGGVKVTFRSRRRRKQRMEVLPELVTQVILDGFCINDAACPLATSCCCNLA